MPGLRRCLRCPTFTRSSLCETCKAKDKARRNAEAPIAKALVASRRVCDDCGKPAKPGDPLTSDHRHIPFAAGGKLMAGNAQVLHRSCNSKKRNRASC